MIHSGPATHPWRPARDWTPPRADTVDLWALDLTPLPGDWELLTPEEAESVHRVRVESVKRQRLASRAHLRRILGLYLDVEPRDLLIEYGPHGKPTLPRAPSLEFNLSHTSSTGMVGLAWGSEIGVDIEKERDLRLLPRVAERFFAPGEYIQWRGVPQGERRRAFFRLWTLKEAYLKAWGTGLTFPSSRFEIEAPLRGPPNLVRTEMGGDEPGRWILEDVPAEAGFAAAVCYEAPPRRLRFWTPDR